MNIIYAFYNKTGDQIFIVKWRDIRLGKKYLLIFDCYDDKWKEVKNNEIIYISAIDIIDTIDPMDLKMAGSYINMYKSKLDFPEGIEKEFIKLIFENKIGKI